MTNDNSQDKKVNQIIKMSDVKREHIDWLYYPYIAKGKITILQGVPGVGKSFITCSFASIVSSGGCFPFSDIKTSVSNVLLLNGEDSVSNTTRPRLEKMGANLNNILVIDETEQLFIVNTKNLREIIEKENIGLIIIDPLQRYFPNIKLNDMNSVRLALAPINLIAQKYNIAIIIVTHTKKSNDIGVYKTIGSSDIGAVARSILTIGDYKNKKILAHTKSNDNDLGASLIFSITDNGIVWESKSNSIKTENIIYIEKEPEIERAKLFLREVLEHGEKSANDIEQLAEKENISNSTLNRAKTFLGIKSTQKNRQWFWSLK